MRIIGSYLASKEIDYLKRLLGGECFFFRTEGLHVDFHSQNCTASFFRLAIFFDNHEDVKFFSFKNEWSEDPTTLWDFHTLFINIIGNGNSIDETNLGLRKKSAKLNSSISFTTININEIQVFSREENIDEENELRYDEALLIRDVQGNGILLSAKLDISDQVEFIQDQEAIKERIKGLIMRLEIK